MGPGVVPFRGGLRGWLLGWSAVRSFFSRWFTEAIELLSLSFSIERLLRISPPFPDGVDDFFSPKEKPPLPLPRIVVSFPKTRASPFPSGK